MLGNNNTIVSDNTENDFNDLDKNPNLIKFDGVYHLVQNGVNITLSNPNIKLNEPSEFAKKFQN